MMRSMTPLSFWTISLMFALLFVLGASREAHAQADLIIATNAEITFPSCTDEFTYFYFFTVVDDGGGISDPTITSLDYTFTAPTKIDEYDSGEYTYATFEMAVTVTAPALGQTANDCFTITYEGESVNPCFDVTRAAREVCSIQTIPACVHNVTGNVRIVAADAECRPSENRIELALPTPTQNAAPAALTVAPAPPRRRPK